jgi:high-affinity Fe2+/Pb2+ permease
MTGPNSQNRFTRSVLAVTRVWLPVGIAAAGLAGILIGRGSTSSPWAAAGVSLIIVALIVWMLNWMFRMSVESNRDREREEEARRYFDRHGHWPGEDP